MKTVLGIDCGTQSTKVLLYDAQSRRVVARAQAPHELISRDDGTREQEANWWVAALKKCLSSIGAELLSGVEAVGVSGQQHGFVPLDESGNVLGPVKLWCDTSTGPECDEIMQRVGGEGKLIEIAGNAILPGYTASKVVWLKKNRPLTYQKMRTILLPHDYLNFVLTGKKTMECGDASGTGFFDVRKRTWSKEVLKAMDSGRDLLACLPPLIGADQPAGVVSEAAAREFGLPAGIMVSVGGGDNMMGGIGTATNSAGSLAVSLGTSGTIYGYSAQPMVDPTGRLAAFCSSTGGWLPLLCTMNCTVATEVTRKILEMDLAAMEKLASSAAPGCDGVVTLPFFNGERTPNLPEGRGCIMGLTPENYTKANLLRSAMEGALFGLKLGVDAFTELGFVPKQVSLIGGGAKSGLWRQMAADIFNLQAICPEEEEAAAFGAALQALAVSSKHDLNAILGEHVRFSKESQKPDPARVKIYEESYRTYKKYVEAVSPLFRSRRKS